jgi:hypothetical protein
MRGISVRDRRERERDEETKSVSIKEASARVLHIRLPADVYQSKLWVQVRSSFPTARRER